MTRLVADRALREPRLLVPVGLATLGAAAAAAAPAPLGLAPDLVHGRGRAEEPVPVLLRETLLQLLQVLHPLDGSKSKFVTLVVSQAEETNLSVDCSLEGVDGLADGFAAGIPVSRKGVVTERTPIRVEVADGQHPRTRRDQSVQILVEEAEGLKNPHLPLLVLGGHLVLGVPNLLLPARVNHGGAEILRAHDIGPGGSRQERLRGVDRGERAVPLYLALELGGAAVAFVRLVVVLLRGLLPAQLPGELQKRVAVVDLLLLLLLTHGQSARNRPKKTRARRRRDEGREALDVGVEGHVGQHVAGPRLETEVLMKIGRRVEEAGRREESGLPLRTRSTRSSRSQSGISATLRVSARTRKRGRRSSSSLGLLPRRKCLRRRLLPSRLRGACPGGRGCWAAGCGGGCCAAGWSCCCCCCSCCCWRIAAAPAAAAAPRPRPPRGPRPRPPRPPRRGGRPRARPPL